MGKSLEIAPFFNFLFYKVCKYVYYVHENEPFCTVETAHCTVTAINRFISYTSRHIWSLQSAHLFFVWLLIWLLFIVSVLVCVCIVRGNYCDYQPTYLNTQWSCQYICIQTNMLVYSFAVKPNVPIVFFAVWPFLCHLAKWNRWARKQRPAKASNFEQSAAIICCGFYSLWYCLVAHS